ncbi:MAG: DNA polymerase/3'-5' exonuclease PolX [Stellaceae bacterium]
MVLIWINAQEAARVLATGVASYWLTCFMPVLNSDIARSLDKLADLLELEGANPFRIRAYRNAARVVGELPRSVTAMTAAGEDLAELPGIGKDLADKIETLAATGHVAVLDEIERRTPPGLLALLDVPGLGPKRARLLNEQLGISALGDLVAAAKAGKIRKLRGFGAKMEQRILQEAEKRATTAPRIKRPVAEDTVKPLLQYLREAEGIRHPAVAGSYRRCRETVGDLDIVVAAARGAGIIDRFVGYEDVAQILSRGPTRSSIVLRNGTWVDLRVVPEVRYGAALQYFTGSKAHNIALRHIAAARGLKLNEYGLFDGNRRVAGRTEDEVYRYLGLPYIEPELREDHGEIEAARSGRLPHLVTLADIRGDLHAHTKASDGRASLAEMAQAAQERGYSYLAITDHSKRVTIAHGLDAKRLAAQIDEIARMNETLSGIVVLSSVEVDILEDGLLDLPNSILSRLDFAIGAVHSAFGLPRDKQTKRLLRAMDNPHLAVLAHPTGRLIGEREGCDIDIERVLSGARERGCAIEVNGQPDRLDINEWHSKLAKEIGVKLVLSTDAHNPGELAFMRYAVEQARRGWLEPSDILNTRSLDGLKATLRRP